MITYGFFNSVNGDRRYNANQIGSYFKGLVSNGVFQNVGKAFIVKPGSGMTINVGSGKAYINEKWIENDNTANYNIDASDSAYDRIDVVVIRLNNTSRTIEIKILKGSATTSPQAQGITRNSSIYDLKLAEIRVKANSTSITTANITDYRANSNVCGFVTGLVKQVDTTELFLQMQEDYKAVRNSIAKDLNVNTQVLTSMKTRIANGTFVDFHVGENYTPGDSLIVMNEKTSHIYSTSEYTIIHNGNNYYLNFKEQPENGSKINIILVKSYVGGTGSVPFYTKSMLDAKFSFDNSYLFDANGKIILSSKATGLGSGFGTSNKDVVTAYISKNVTTVAEPALKDCKNLQKIYVDNTSDKIKLPNYVDSNIVVYNDTEKDTFFNYAEFLLQQLNSSNVKDEMLLFNKTNTADFINEKQCGKFVSDNDDNVGYYDSSDNSYNITTSSDNSQKSYWNFIQDVNVEKGTYFIGFDYETNTDFHFCIRQDNVFTDLGNIGAITDGKIHRFVTKVDIGNALNIYQVYFSEKPNIKCKITNIFVMNKFDYLKEFDNLQDFITYSQNEVSPELFGAVGDGIYDDTEALQSAIDYCFKNGVQLKLRSGKTYCISKPLNLSNTAVLIIDGSWSTLKAKKTMNYMLTYDGSANTKNDVKTVVKNITADCNGVAGFIDLVYSFKFNLENFLVKNCKTTAINVQKGGSFVCQNGTIVGDCTPDSRAIYNATSDCHFTELVIVDMKKAIFNGGTNFYSKVHAWLTGNVSNSIFFSHFAGFASLSQCQCDTYETGYLLRTSYDLSLNSCTYYNNYHLYDSDIVPVIFKFNDGISPFARRICCNNCSFNSPNINAVMSNVKDAQISFNGYNHFINIEGADIISKYEPYLQSKVTTDFDNALNRITYRNNLCYFDFSLKFTSTISASNLLEIATIASPYYPSQSQMFQVFLTKTLAGSDCMVAKMFIDTTGKVTLRVPGGDVSAYQYLYGHIYYEPKQISD